MGQNQKSSLRAYVFRTALRADCARDSRHVHFVPIQLKKYSLADQLNFSALLVLPRAALASACITTSFLPAVAFTRGWLAVLHRPILRMAIDRGAVAPVESLAVELRWAAPKFFQRQVGCVGLTRQIVLQQIPRHRIVAHLTFEQCRISRPRRQLFRSSFQASVARSCRFSHSRDRRPMQSLHDRWESGCEP